MTKPFRTRVPQSQARGKRWDENDVLISDHELRRRAEEIAAEDKAKHPERWRHLRVSPPSPDCTARYLAWLRGHDPSAPWPDTQGRS